MQYKEEKVKTSDGAMLNAWFFELAKKSPNWVVISGSGDGNMADNLEIVNSFLSAGYNVATYDYRGYGASSDFKIDPDLFIYPQFITDLNAVLDHLRKSRAITKFDLYGLNIGAGLSIGVGANRPETKRIIADGPWTSLEGMKSKIKERSGKDVTMPFGFDKNHEPIYAFDKPKGPLKQVLVIISAQDPIVGPSDVKSIKGVSEVYVVKNSPANADNFSTDKNIYFEKISKFLSSK
jgi:pimeloyl-ACP methyl ester carboxylesterase